MVEFKRTARMAQVATLAGLVALSVCASARADVVPTSARDGLPLAKAEKRADWDATRFTIGAIRWDAWYGAGVNEDVDTVGQVTKVLSHPTTCEAKTCLWYAWNEFDEGGWLCPTRNADGTPNLMRLEAIKAALAE